LFLEHQKNGKSNSGFSLVFDGFWVSGNLELRNLESRSNLVQHRIFIILVTIGGIFKQVAKGLYTIWEGCTDHLLDVET
jgi:hypothetical protein